MNERPPEVLRQRAAQVSSIKSHPGWAANVEEAKRKIAKLEKLAGTMALAEAGADQRRLDYLRGFIDGLHWTYRNPDAAERKHLKWVEEQMEAEDG